MGAQRGSGAAKQALQAPCGFSSASFLSPPRHSHTGAAHSHFSHEILCSRHRAQRWFTVATSCRSPQDPIVSSPRKTPEEGLEDGEAQRSMVPPRQPLVVGALAVMLLASSINEVKLGIPAVSIRLGLQVWPTAMAPHPCDEPIKMRAAVPAVVTHAAGTSNHNPLPPKISCPVTLGPTILVYPY